MKKKVLIIVLVLFLIIILLFFINTLRNYFILKDLKSKINELNTIESFSEIISSNNVETKVSKNKNIIKMENNNSNNIMYFNTETNEMIEEDIKTGEKILYPDKPASVSLVLPDLNTLPFSYIIKNIITTTTINGQKCYKINVDGVCYYLSTDSGLTIRAVEDNEIINYSNYKLKNIEEIKFDKDNVTNR